MFVDIQTFTESGGLIDGIGNKLVTPHTAEVKSLVYTSSNDCLCSSMKLFSHGSWPCVLLQVVIIWSSAGLPADTLVCRVQCRFCQKHILGSILSYPLILQRHLVHG